MSKRRSASLRFAVLGALLLPGVGAAESQRPLIATAPSGAFRLEAGEGQLWLVPAAGGASEQLPLPPAPGATGNEAEGSLPLAFISPDEQWIYAADFGAVPARLYRRASAGGALRFELVPGLPGRVRTFFAGQIKKPSLPIAKNYLSFGAWSGDSARLLLACNFLANNPADAPPAAYATNWLCYYNTKAGEFELTERLRAANRGRVDLTHQAASLPPEVPVLSAEPLGQEGPEEPAKVRLARADAELNQVYARLLQGMAPEAKEKLRQEQRAWLRERDTAGWLHAGESWSPFPEASNREGLAIATEARVAELKKALPERP